LRDHPILQSVSLEASAILSCLKKIVKSTDEELSAIMGIAPAKALTCIKPSGTVSQLVDSSSGMHPRYAKYYIRRLRISAEDPVANLLINQGMEPTPENGETVGNVRTWVFKFPIKSPETSLTNKDCSALEQLNYWKMLKTSWCDHNPSCTIYVKEHEWLGVISWVYDNFDIVGGISFFPEANTYSQAPYEEISANEYNELTTNFPEINLELLNHFEKADYTTGSGELACAGGKCEL
jgi:hypothetical protein